jgi:XTP/dITP diphosphohydrolase
MSSREEKLAAFGRLLDIMDDLREKCPWDRKQTFDSLRQNTIEETYELATAISRHDMNEISKELGDVLLHVVFYAKMGSEDKNNFSDLSSEEQPRDNFDIADVCNRLCDKLIFRHPHVYGDEAARNAEDVSKLWEQVKLKEKGGNKTVLGGIPDSLPSLVKAYRIQDKAANVGFDWKNKEDVWAKVKEEIAEFEAELRKESANFGGSPENVSANNSGSHMTEEFGDLLFSLINAARLYKIRPDNALEQTNLKFIRRFNYIEAKAKEQGRELKDMTLAEMDALWERAKTDMEE